MATAGNWVFTNEFRSRFSEGMFLTGDSYKVALFQSTSNVGASSTTYAGLTNETANGSGYSTGGSATTLSKSGTTTVTFDATDVVFTASGGGSITARFAVLYELSGNVVAYCLLDSTPADAVVQSGNTLTVTIHASGVFAFA